MAPRLSHEASYDIRRENAVDPRQRVARGGEGVAQLRRRHVGPVAGAEAMVEPVEQRERCIRVSPAPGDADTKNDEPSFGIDSKEIAHGRLDGRAGGRSLCVLARRHCYTGGAHPDLELLEDELARAFGFELVGADLHAELGAIGGWHGWEHVPPHRAMAAASLPSGSVAADVAPASLRERLARCGTIVARSRAVHLRLPRPMLPTRESDRVIRRAKAIVLACLLACASNAVAWETRLAGTGNGSGEADAVAIASDGDVVAAGYVDQAGTGADFTVVRLGGVDGTERWRTVLASPFPYGDNDEARAVAIDSDGNVVAVGNTSDVSQGIRFTVVKLNGATGAVLWRYDTDGGATAVLVDATGDVYAGGRATFGSRVVKLGGDSGVPIWTFHDVLGLGIESAAMLPGDDVVVSQLFSSTGRVLGQSRQVIRLDHSSGTPVWTMPGPALSQPPYMQGTRGSLAVAPGGDVFAVALGDPTVGGVLRLAGDSGQVQWSQTVAGSPDGSFSASAIDTTWQGDLAIWGSDTLASCYSPLGFPDTVRLHLVVLGHADGAITAAHVIDAATGEDIPGCGRRASIGASATALTAAPAGDTYVVGTLGGGGAFFFGARLSGADLHEVWRHGANEIGLPRVPGVFAPRAAAGPPANGLIAVGSTSVAPNGPSQFGVLNLAGSDGAVHACGDGALDVGETCDDGTLGGTVCCSADCRTMQPDGTACDDGSLCTLGDHCSGGLCYGSSRLPCEPCGTCDGRQGCVPNDPSACARSTVTNGAVVSVARKPSGRGRFDWTLRSGPATTLADLGDPLTTTGYAVCGIADGRLVLRAVAPPGGCAGRKCWRRSRGGFEYVNPAAPDGLSRLSIRAGAGGRSRFHASGERKHLLTPDLPIDGGLVVELLRTDQPAVCWTAEHDTVTKNNTRRFRATGN